MRFFRSWAGKILAAAALVLALVAAVGAVKGNRPLVTAPRGTAPLDNDLDTSDVVHLVADEANVLMDETRQIIDIYNANWKSLAGRVLAVVTVEQTDDAGAEAWQWAERLALGENDALLLMETGVGKDCVLVAQGSFLADLNTLHDAYLASLTYTPMRYDDFDSAALAVFDRLHYLYGYDQESHRQADRMEAYTVLSVFAALLVPVLLHMIAERVDNRRFKRWHSSYGHTQPPVVPWKTVFFWHRVGSRWYMARVSGEWIDYRSLLRKNRNDMEAKVASGRYR